MYFNYFDKILVEIKKAGFRQPAEFSLLTDITKNVRFKKEVIDNITLYDYYDIKEGETLEIISELIYGSPYYHWVLMLLNDIYDITEDMPISSYALDDYINSKYNNTYVMDTYGTDLRGLLIDILDAKLFASISPEGTFNFINRQTETVSSFNCKTLLEYDPTLNINVVKFFDKNSNNYLDIKQWVMDFANVKDIYSPLYLYDYETTKNDNKRRIKVLSPEMMQVVLKNFRDLMRSN